MAIHDESNKIDLEIFIGLEMHVQILSETKLFCTCSSVFGSDPNVNVCPVCLGYPGTLPIPNEEAVFSAYRIAHALHCTLAGRLCFDRKNYFYPDLAKNYQISQFNTPIGIRGYFDFFNGEEKSRVGIIQAHLEEDAGKLIHASDISLCDYNRGGTPLMEVVTEPTIKTSLEAEQVLRQFRYLVRYIGVCDGNMQEGSLRCDANISVNKKGKGLGEKVEIKNINSFRFVRQALEYEVKRQTEMFFNGDPIIQETRLWNENRGITEGMRAKEHANDYRYFPEPDIIPVIMDELFFKKIEKQNIETPFKRAIRLMEKHGLSYKNINFFIEEKNTADFFEEVASYDVPIQRIINMCMSDVSRLLHQYKKNFGEAPLTAERFACLLILLENGKIHGKLAKVVLEKIFEEDKNPQEIIDNFNLNILTEQELMDAVLDVLEHNSASVEQYKNGDIKVLGFFMGQIMKKTKGRADPIQLKDILTKELKDT